MNTIYNRLQKTFQSEKIIYKPYLLNYKILKHIKTWVIELIGIKTQNGILIQGKTYHFIDRVFGSVEERRSGVSIEDVKQALTTPVEIKDTILKGNRISQVFVGEHAKVSVNPDSNILIQVNLNHRKYRNKDRYE